MFSNQQNGEEFLHLPNHPAAMRHGRGVFWNPTSSFIKELATFLQDKKVLEVFAGNGLLAGYLFNKDVQVTATSILSGMDAHEYGIYHPIEELGAVDAVKKYRDSHDVLMYCWPTVTNAAYNSLKEWPENKPFVFIGEVTDYSKGHLGGCATDEFFENIEIIQEFSSYKGNYIEKAFIGKKKEK